MMTEPRTKNATGTFYTRYNGVRLANTEYVGNDYYRLYDAGTVATPSVHTKTLNSASISPADSYELLNNNGNTWNGLPYNQRNKNLSSPEIGHLSGLIQESTFTSRL